MSESKVKVVVEMVVTDQEVAGYIVETVAANPTTWSNGSPVSLSEAVVGFLVESIGPEYPEDPDAKAEVFFDRYHAGEWLQSATIKIEGQQ